MAVYGRHKEKWNPTKIKSKVSKNNTYDLTSAQGQLWFWLDPQRIEGGALYGGYGLVSPTADGIESIVMDIDDGSAIPQLEENTASRFDSKALYFAHGATSFVHSSATSTLKSLDILTAPERGYDTYISFWIRVPRLNYGTSYGHCFGGLYREIPANITGETLTDLDAAILFNVSSSGAMEFRIQKSGSTSHLFYQTVNNVLVENQWTHVTYLIKNVQASDHLTMIQVYINGQRVQMGTPVGIGFDVNTDFDGTSLEVLLGNSVFGYRDNASMGPGEGFVGNLADFTIMSQPTNGLVADQDTKAKFIYEATTTGAYHLHSGIHSSSPRLEQLDLDRDSLYPPNFTLENYTMGAYESPISRVSSRSESRYIEGYNTADVGYTWTEKASKKFVQSKYQYNGVSEEWEETTTVMPHLRLDPTDTLLTHGNWYSDARSEIFLADRDPTDGFVVSSTTAGLATPRTDDELYREHHTLETAQKFVEIDVPEDYKDCFVIDIPLPNEADLDIGTDLSGTELSRINGNNVRGGAQAQIANMAYYNFSSGRWQKVLSSNATLEEAAPNSTNFIDDMDIGFSPMTGIVVPNSEKGAKHVLPTYGLPTSDFGFPFDDKFVPTDGQKIDMSKYIDMPVILEGWEIKTRVVPKVGYSDETGAYYSGVAPGKSPFHYGGHGEAAVLFNYRKHMTGFSENIITDGANDYHVGTTIPTAYFVDDGTGVYTEAAPPMEQPGLVTSGITAFLMKTPKLTSAKELKAAWQDTARTKTMNAFTNMTSDGEFSIWQDTQGPNYQIENLEEPMNNRMTTADPPTVPPEWANPNTDWSNYQNTSLIGWLQQVYHNEAGLDGSYVPLRTNWVRQNDSENAYRYTDGTSIIDMLDKEGATYVEDLLYANTSEYDLNVSGPAKTVGKFSHGAPITNFFIKDHTGTDLGVHKTSSDTSSYFAVGTSSDTEISVGDGTLADHSIIPRYGAGTFITRSFLPRLNIPTKRVSNSDSVDALHKLTDLQTSLVDDAIVVLAPTDQLTLGIQNSISTTYASQQIKGGTNNFIRWGRTSLKIPQQDSTTTNSYLRLYVKKTRSDKDFNIVADSSNYNQNVNRDLGDHANADQFITSNTTIYSGSIADDIIGPTVFTHAESSIRVDSSLAPSGTAFLPGRERWGDVAQLIGDGLNMENNRHGNQQRPHWNSVIKYLELNATPPYNGTLSGAQRSFDYLFRNWTEAEINTAIQNADYIGTNGPGIDQYGFDWGTTTLQSLGIPVSNLVIPWTALNQTVFNYGGPLPGYENDFPSIFGSDYRNIFMGFLTRYSPVYPEHAGDGNSIIYQRHEMDGGAWPFRSSGGWYIEEINPNAGAPIPRVDINDPTSDLLIEESIRRRPYSYCGAISAWYAKFKLPFFQNNVPGGTVATITIEFRCVKIDTDNPPKYTNGDTVVIGDAFIFTADHQIIQVKSGAATPSEIQNQIFVDNQVIFIVMGGGSPYSIVLADGRYSSGDGGAEDWNTVLPGAQVLKSYHVGVENPTDWDPATPSTPDRFLTWTQLWTRIREVIELQASYNDALQYTVEDGGVDSLFTINFTNETLLQRELRTNLSAINTSLGFELCGVDLGSGNPVGDDWMVGLGLRKEIYWVQGSQDGTFSPTTWDSAPELDYDEIDDDNPQEQETTEWNELTGRLYDASGVEQTNQGGVKVGNFLDNLLAAFRQSRYFSKEPWPNGLAISAGSPIGTAIPNQTQWETLGGAPTYGRIQIDYTNLPSQQPLFSFTKETFNEEVGRLIDRKVVFRNSEKENTVKDIILDPSKIGQASTFGSLKRFSTFIDEDNPYWDSIMPLVNVEEAIDLSTFTPPVYESTPFDGMGWLLDSIEEKDGKQFPVSSATVKMDNQNPSQYDTTNTGAYIYSTVDETGTSHSFPPVGTIGSVTYDTLSVTNYLHRDFRTISDFTKFTVRNLVFGFGDGPSGRIKMRPSTSIWKEYDASTRQTTSDWPNELKIDPIRGFRFGLLGYNEKPRYTFSQRHFGHLCDMFEQAVDTKRGNFASDTDSFGSPVTINPINPTNPEVPKLMENTSRYNKETDATITIPYIESNYEAKPNPTNLNSESLRVDVAGSIRTRAALAPGNVAANIRRRG